MQFFPLKTPVLVLLGLILAHFAPFSSGAKIVFNSTYVDDAWVNCFLWASVNFKRDRPDYTYNVISGPFGAPEGAAETWLKVRVAELGVVDPSRVRSAAVGVRGGFAGVGENIRMYDVPSNWAAENLTCTTAPAGGDPRWHNVTAAAEFPFPDPPHSWALWNVTDLLIAQLGRGEMELNLALGPGREECEPVHLLASSSIDKPYLEVEYV
eukprot:TRINITY_DN10754_c2_g2_i1.p1 TRINITY_DN10754_c2_g2~~TRINITY_DN10754_c2_g2_i1.p1  ORF type:complete len:210 (+),score=60.65 TRINITY_DN10754_c2_g2_i1:129-758(+)